METIVIFLLCSITVAYSRSSPKSTPKMPAPNRECWPLLELKLESDQPSLRVPVNSEATLKCCYKRSTTQAVDQHWVARYKRDVNISAPEVMDPSPRVTLGPAVEEVTGQVCHNMTLLRVQVNDTGLYQCFLNRTPACLFTHGTYLQVFTPLRRTLDISESWKNSIITIEGVLLLFSVLLPGICQMGKTKRHTQLSRKKRAEEENIYEGLNLDDCNSTYHQIQRSQHGPYQDVANPPQEDNQLEKP
ncbi:B-cell antigen receptor complex-associated protein alpha chain [Engraulis encrasicolus]|uniref:B-cell antigen receptor complex-associated protein alpha chain n=1 Tax=Engraulis encrasicolus TaxID=184585 RepID=UPI002FD42C04